MYLLYPLFTIDQPIAVHWVLCCVVLCCLLPAPDGWTHLPGGVVPALAGGGGGACGDGLYPARVCLHCQRVRQADDSTRFYPTPSDESALFYPITPFTLSTGEKDWWIHSLLPFLMNPISSTLFDESTLFYPMTPLNPFLSHRSTSNLSYR